MTFWLQFISWGLKIIKPPTVPETWRNILDILTMVNESGSNQNVKDVNVSHFRILILWKIKFSYILSNNHWFMIVYSTMLVPLEDLSRNNLNIWMNSTVAVLIKTKKLKVKKFAALKSYTSLHWIIHFDWKNLFYEWFIVLFVSSGL